MSKKPALGRGLGAILPDYEPSSDEHKESAAQSELEGSNPFEERRRRIGRTSEIPLDLIDPNPYQPRSDFNGESLDELADSIRELGVVQPITVRPAGGGRYELITGERRLRAARRAGLRQIPAYVREADTEAMLEMALVENVQRKDLNPIEIAVGYSRLLEECSLTHEEVAKKVGKKRSTVTNTLRLLKLAPRIQAALRDGTLSEGHARVLIGIDDEDLQKRLLERIIRDELSVRSVEKLARTWLRRETMQSGRAKARTSAQQDPHLQAVTDQLRRTYGTRVAVHNRIDGSGRIELDYFSSEELERLLELLLRS
jgi:ParB family chromosome partitioning protein